MTKNKLVSKNIAILGCGWLGLPLAEHLLTIGHQVKGSTTSEDKLNVLKSKNIMPFLLQISEDGISGDLTFFDSVDVLIIAIPPKLRSNPNRKFNFVIEHCKEACLNYKIKEVVFISSTSVYGSKSRVINEESSLLPETNAGKQLALCERILTQGDKFSTTVLRMGGLIGGQRHPIYQLSKKDYVNNPKGSINLIHLTDCILIISKLLNHPITKNVYNCVTPYHPSREKYYTKMARIMNCKVPLFKAFDESDRQISSEKIVHHLRYDFKVKNLLILS
tara:strand:- start:1098 stop:1928 length:831 start_codon:yes stop_codon:yes gene_type:complete